MAFYSDNMEYEKAAKIRDRIIAISKIMEKQKVIIKSNKDIDAIKKIFIKVLNKYDMELNESKTAILDFEEYSKNNNINYPTTVNIKNRALNQLRKEILM